MPTTTKAKRVRFATLVRECGPVTHACAMTTADWQKAHAEGRFMTVYHGDNGDFCTPVAAQIRHDGFVNTICKLATARPIPADWQEVIGLRDNQDAWDAIQNDTPPATT